MGVFLKKILGWWFDYSKWDWKMKWGQIKFGWCGPALKIYRFYQETGTINFGLVFVDIYVNTPWPKGDDQGYGFSFAESGIHYQWGGRGHVWLYPWDWTFIRKWVQVNGSSWAEGRLVWVEVPEQLNPDAIAMLWKHPYKYKLNNGEVQKRVATIYVDRYEYRRRWLTRLPWWSRKYESIDVRFNKEVGERTGSWKGGCVGCSYKMLPGEKPLDTLLRMQSERKF